MESTFRELGGLLKNGPVDSKEEVFLKILEVVLSCTTQTEAKQFFTPEFLTSLLKFALPKSVYNKHVYQILINIFSEETFNLKICKNEDGIMNMIVTWCLEEIRDKNSMGADECCMLLSNVTRYQSCCEAILQHISPLEDTLHNIISVFSILEYNPTCYLNQLAMVLCNLSQLGETRTILTRSNNCFLQKLVPFMNHESDIRRRGIIGVVHNCAFDSSKHAFMLGDEVDILPRLLLPLAGPEQFDDEDNDKLPVELQYLPETKIRESDPEIRKQLMETLNQLCATKYGRQFLRDHNAYIILRELHKWERDPNALLACENVVDILIRTEDEIGIDHLDTVQIPEDLEEKFNKALVNDES